MKMAQSLNLVIKNNILEVKSLIESIIKFCNDNNVKQEAIDDMNLAVEELIVNIISYGFDDDKEHEIYVNLEINDSKLKVEILDEAMPFNPFEEVDVPDLDTPIEERKIGGLGIHLVKSLMDSYEYRRYADNNIITLEKKIL